MNELYEQEKEKYQREIGTPDLSNQSQSKSTIRKKKSLMERLTKDSVVALDEIVEYYQLPEISLSSDPLAWWNEKKDHFPILSHLAQKFLQLQRQVSVSFLMLETY